MNTEKLECVCACACICAHGCVYVSRTAAALLVLLSEALFASGGSVTTDARAKFTSAKVMYIKQVLGKVTDVTYIFVLEKLSQTLIAFFKFNLLSQQKCYTFLYLSAKDYTFYTPLSLWVYVYKSSI